jgi:hypothetical protein
MGRKVSVALEADIAGFVGPVKVATKSVDDLDDKVGKLDHDLNRIPPDAAKAGAALKLLSGDVNDVGMKVQNIGDKNTGLAVLDSKIKSTRTEVRKLADEFTKTGDVDVFKKLGDSQGRLSALTKIRKDLADSVSSGVGEGMLAGFKMPGLQYVIAGVGASLAVPLIAGLGGALAGGAGFGIAGLGIAGAIMGDPEHFGLAWDQVLGQLKVDFALAAKPFTGETYAAIASIGPMIASWHLDTIFANALTYAEPLVHGLENFATGTVKGIGALVEKGGPAVNALSAGMSELGHAAEVALGSIADGAEGGALALHDTVHAVSLVVEGFGAIVGAAEKAYGFVRDHPIISAIGSGGMSIPLSVWTAFDHQVSQLSTTEYGLEQAAKAAGHQFDMQGDDLTALSQKLNTATLSVDSLAASMVNKLFTATMDIDRATLGVAESQTRLRETFEENAKTLKKNADQLDINTKQGQANRESVLASVTANMQLYQSQIAAGMSANDAADAYDQNTAALEAQLQKAHLTQGEIDGLIGKYRGIPKKVDTDIAINGLTSAINGLADLIRQINGIHDKTVTVTVKQVGDNPKGQSRGGSWASGGIRRAAVGMILPPSDPGTVLSAEPQTGGEALIPLRGISQGRAMSLAQTVGDSYGFSVSSGRGGGGIALTLVFSGGNDDFLNRAVQRGFSDGRIQLYAGGQRVQTKP